MHPVERVEVFAESNAEEDVVGLVVFRTQEMRVVGGHDGQPELLGEPEDAAVELGLAFGLVRLDLEVVVLEGVGVP